MDAAEHLSGDRGAMRLAGRYTVERGAAGAVDARQAENARAQRQPCRVRRVARGAPTSDGRAFVHPCPAGIAIDARGGEIAEPLAIQQRAVVREHRIVRVIGRH